MSQEIFSKLGTVYLRLRNIELDGVAAIKFRVNSGGGDSTGYFDINIRTNTGITKLTNVRITRFRQCRY